MIYHQGRGEWSIANQLTKWLAGLCIWLFIIGSHSSFAQFTDVQFQNLDLRDGLSQSTVYTSYQDDEGFMWFGTRDGLNKYDGVDFTVFKKEEADSVVINQNSVRAITGDNAGNIWIGTDGGGLYSYSKQFKQFNHIIPEDDDINDFATSNILSMVVVGKSDLWIGTRDRGLLKYNIDTHQLNEISGSFGQVWSLEVDSTTGTIWAGTDAGLIQIDGQGGQMFLIEDMRIASLRKDNKILWIGTYNNGLYKYELTENKLEKVTELSDEISVLCLLPLAEQLWVGTSSNGLVIFDKQTLKADRYSTEQSRGANLKDDSIRSLSQDRTGTVWVGSNNAGLFTWSKFRNKFALYQNRDNESNTLNNNVVLSFTEDKRGRLWVGTNGGGINILDRKDQRFSYYTGEGKKGKDINNGNVITLLTDRNGAIWIGTDGGGLNKWDPNTECFEYFMHDADNPQSISNNSVLTLLEDGDGFLWVGTYQGLNRFNPQKETFSSIEFSKDDATQLSDDRILALEEDREGNIWIGTYAGGLNRLDPQTGKISHFKYQLGNEKGISSNRIQSIYQGENGDIWIGTYKGLNRLDRQTNTFEIFTTADGLANDVIYGILPDPDGYLWLSTNGGISRFHPETGKVLNFTIYDGLQSQEFNGGAYYKNDDELFFGGVRGFNIIDPHHISLNRREPPVEITSFAIAGDDRSRMLSRGNPLNLSYDQNFFTVEFAALDFVAPESNTYKYKLEGFDEEWIKTSGRNRARYTNVPPGNYTFTVQAANSDGTWNKTGATLAVKISPPYWKTWWFSGLIIIAVFGICYGMYRYRINALLRVQRTRQRIASDLHDEVSATLSSITYFAQAIRQVQNGSQTEHFVELISDSAYEAKDKITDIIWSIDPEQDDWISLLSKCRRFASDLFESKGIDYELNIDTDIDRPLDLDLRQHLWLIFKEMVVNAARHSKANRVDIYLGMQGDALILIVQDNGIGIPNDYDTKNGHGIKNIKKRANKLDAELTLETDPKIGTRWFFQFNYT